MNSSNHNQQNTEENNHNFDYSDDDFDVFLDTDKIFDQSNLLQDNFTDFQDINSLSVNQISRRKSFHNQSQILPPVHAKEQCSAFKNFDIPLVPVSVLPSKYQNIFSSFPFFNYVQTTVFNDVFYTNKNLVITAPTSSGKTVILEIAIIRLLANLNFELSNKFKIIYMAPIKALCSEKYRDWYHKFEKLHNIKVVELTGDTDTKYDYVSMDSANIICTTPEKWDMITRKYKNRNALLNEIRLFLIDEIHVLGESSRGACIEAVISRMKKMTCSSLNNENNLRFLAISATIPNIEDFSQWLSSDLDYQKSATFFKLNDTYRPVKLNKVILGYYCSPKTSDFCFDLSLNYKLENVIRQYSDSKPTLIFCSTRKGTIQAAQILAKTNRYIRNQANKNFLFEQAKSLKDPKIRELVVNNGIGIHHAGMDSSDRALIENLFLTSNLFVLFSTSTLSIGVNLPAHLVIIKSTKYYFSNKFENYSTTQILQMIGRAGRPQFDTSATAVIMTKHTDKLQYETLIEGNQLIESQLHKNLIEHLNVEICLKTIGSLSEAIKWLKSTFLYTRLCKNPLHYDLNLKLKNKQELIDKYLSELCIENLNKLMNFGLIENCDFVNDPNHVLQPTQIGQLMAKYCILFDTMKNFIVNLELRNNSSVSTKTLKDLIVLISESREFDDIKLRTSEKSLLNALNNNGKAPKAKDGEQVDSKTIRYVLDGKIKTRSMKICVLIQALFGSISVTDFSLNQDIYRIFRIAQRISKCVLELFYVTKLNSVNNYETFINLLTLHKCINCRLWYDSPHIFRQFNRIGLGLSQSFVRQSITSFDKVLQLNQFEIERRLNKNSPFGTIVIETVKKLPEFRITCEIISLGQVNLSVSLLNFDFLKKFNDGGTLGLKTPISLIIGDEINNLVFTKRIYLENFLTNTNVWTKRLYLNENINGSVIFVSLVFLNFVGLDLHETFEVFQNKNLPEKLSNIPTFKQEEKQSVKKSKEIQLRLTRSKSKNMSLTQTNKRKIESEIESVEPKVPKQDTRIITFDEYKKQTANVEQPRLFKFKIKNKENIENEKTLSSNKDFENKKERNASILSGIYNF